MPKNGECQLTSEEVDAALERWEKLVPREPIKQEPATEKVAGECR